MRFWVCQQMRLKLTWRKLIESWLSNCIQIRITRRNRGKHSKKCQQLTLAFRSQIVGNTTTSMVKILVKIMSTTMRPTRRISTPTKFIMISSKGSICKRIGSTFGLSVFSSGPKTTRICTTTRRNLSLLSKSKRRHSKMNSGTFPPRSPSL